MAGIAISYPSPDGCRVPGGGVFCAWGIVTGGMVMAATCTWIDSQGHQQSANGTLAPIPGGPAGDWCYVFNIQPGGATVTLTITGQSPGPPPAALTPQSTTFTCGAYYDQTRDKQYKGNCPVTVNFNF
jgi:hypothetical protein